MHINLVFSNRSFQEIMTVSLQLSGNIIDVVLAWNKWKFGNICCLDFL